MAIAKGQLSEVARSTGGRYLFRKNVGIILMRGSLSDGDMYQDVAGGILSPYNCCKPFDERANGISKAEGASVVILTPLEVAVADKDLYAVVRLPSFVVFSS